MKTIFLQVVVKILATVRYNLMVLEGPTDRDFHERNEIGRLSCKKDLWEGLSLARLDRARRRALAVCWRSTPSHRSDRREADVEIIKESGCSACTSRRSLFIS